MAPHKLQRRDHSREHSFAEERAALAIEAAELGVYEIDLATRSVDTNRRFDAIFGFSEQVDHASYLSAIHPEDMPLRNSAFVEAMITGRVCYEVRVIWKDGSIHWVKVTGKVFFDQTGSPVTVLGVAQETTEQKEFAEELSKQVADRTKDLLKSNQELKNINAELQQYVHVSSHDLQEPLRKIRIYTDMIMKRDRERLSEVSRAHFEKITLAAERLSRALKDLLNFNSINKDEQYSAVNLNEVIKMAEDDLELVVAQKSAVIECGRLPEVKAVAVQMHQLFYNLLNNALKFSSGEAPPHVAIMAHPISSQNAQQYHHLDGSRKYVEIIVRDNGIGFHQSAAEKIFTMFQRLHDRRVYDGTGIGLALCRKVVQNHGGRIWASSAPGKGASFHIILPTT